MKIILLICILSLSLSASIKEKMFNFYQNKKYEDACNIGFRKFQRYNRDEDFLSLYAFACLKSDYIDRLTFPIAMLKYSKEARANSAYLSTILMQKKLLLHSMVDGYSLEDIHLPTTDYILSKVFDFYIALGTHEPRIIYFFDDKNDKKLTYKLYLSKGNKIDKIVIEELYDSVIVKKHTYW